MPDAVAVLARAFADNPINVAVIGHSRERRLRSNAFGMRALLSVALRHARALVAYREGSLVGGMVAVPPLGHPLPPPSLWMRLRVRVAQGQQEVLRWAEVFHILDATHPRLPHWYLGSLGVDPDHQSSGVGGALLGHLLARADREQLPIYLETDRARTVGFYEARGFRVEEEIQVLGTPCWRMWRAVAS